MSPSSLPDRLVVFVAKIWAFKVRYLFWISTVGFWWNATPQNWIVEIVRKWQLNSRLEKLLLRLLVMALVLFVVQEKDLTSRLSCSRLRKYLNSWRYWIWYTECWSCWSIANVGRRNCVRDEMSWNFKCRTKCGTVVCTSIDVISLWHIWGLTSWMRISSRFRIHKNDSNRALVLFVVLEKDLTSRMSCSWLRKYLDPWRFWILYAYSEC